MSDNHDDWGEDEMDAAMLEQYQELRRQYVSEAPARLAELRQDLAAYRAHEEAALEALRTRFHQLAGSGGSYGFPAITTASREAEQWIGEHPSPGEADYAFLEGAIGRIAEAFEAAWKVISGQ